MLTFRKMSKMLLKHLITTEIFKNYVNLRFSRTNLFVYKNRHLWFEEKITNLRTSLHNQFFG